MNRYVIEHFLVFHFISSGPFRDDILLSSRSAMNCFAVLEDLHYTVSDKLFTHSLHTHPLLICHVPHAEADQPISSRSIRLSPTSTVLPTLPSKKPSPICRFLPLRLQQTLSRFPAVISQTARRPNLPSSSARARRLPRNCKS